MGKTKFLVAAAVATLGFAGSANAAQFITATPPDGVPSGVYGDTSVTCAAGQATPCSFTRTFTFTTPTGYNNVNLDVSSILNGAMTDINFTTVTFNGVNFNIVATGIQELRNLFNQTLVAGATNTIVVNGTTSGDASFTGNLAFSNVPAVPEPGTWAMMLIGFGAMGYSMRRRRSNALLVQAA